MATAQEKRLMVRDKYRTIIGRNIYSQARRNYCYKKYADGKYYSDCSSSISHTYKEVGLGFGILNTVGMWESGKLVDVPVIIEKGQVKNPEVLRIGDMLLFAGSDTSRKAWGYVGHVEMVGEIDYRPASSDKSGPQVSGGTANVLALSPAEAGRSPVVMLYGHGSGNPKRHEMVAYCRTRYNSKSSTPLGHKGLIRVRRFILDDDGGTTGTADANYGVPTEGAVRSLGKAWDGRFVTVEGGNAFIRKGPGTEYGSLGVLAAGEKVPYMGFVFGNGWLLVEHQGQLACVSGKYGRIEL